MRSLPFAMSFAPLTKQQDSPSSDALFLFRERKSAQKESMRHFSWRQEKRAKEPQGALPLDPCWG
jgi:hypothetical protein